MRMHELAWERRFPGFLSGGKGCRTSVGARASRGDSFKSQAGYGLVQPFCLGKCADLSPRWAVMWARIRAGQFTRPADELDALGEAWSALFSEAIFLIPGPTPLEADVGAHPHPTRSSAFMGSASGPGREGLKPQQGKG